MIRELWKLPPGINSYQIQKTWFSKSSFTGQPRLCCNSFVIFYGYCSDFKHYHLKILSIFSDVRHPSNATLVSRFLLGLRKLRVGLSPFPGTPMQEDISRPKESRQSLLSELVVPLELLWVTIHHCLNQEWDGLELLLGSRFSRLPSMAFKFQSHASGKKAVR